MPIKIKSTGGGSVSIDVPNTGSDFTLTAPANNATLFTTSGGTISGDVTLTSNVAISNNVTIGGNSVSPFAGFKNKLINGDFSVAQRGTTYSLTNSVAYGSVDRWIAFQSGTASGTANRFTGSPPSSFQYSLRIGRTKDATTTGAIVTAQALETVNSIMFAGQTVTLSFYAKAGANFSASGSNISVQVYSGTGLDQSTSTWINSGWTGAAYPINTTQSITSSWVRYTFTGTVSASATQLGVLIQYTPVGTAGSDDYLYITGVQLEEGSVATPFERRPYGMELALCQRYCQWVPFSMGFSSSGAGTFLNQAVPFQVIMRAVPIMASIVADPDATQANALNASNAFNANYTTVRNGLAGLSASGAGNCFVYGYRSLATAEL